MKPISTQYLMTTFREKIEKEKIISVDLAYISPVIDSWWTDVKKDIPIHFLKFKLISILLDALAKKDLNYFDKIGCGDIAGICITNIFNIASPELALVVHEALSDLFHLTDLHYPYEEHKVLYLKPTGNQYKDWGNGYGEILPHSDDLYEDLDTDYLSLTICKDFTKTPTLLFLLKDILKDFSDLELMRLFGVRAKFISGKNVNILKTRERKIIEYFPEVGFKFYLDFRKDVHGGDRMIFDSQDDKSLIDKIKHNMMVLKPHESISKTGTFLMIANHKVLHARGQLNLDIKVATKLAKTLDFRDAQRLLYRSKGQRKNYN
ncbi:MAG: hypothetical protein Q8L78_05240 [Coxiellaceae bacterium]|nr:hypothetical protein [Coxiellaceae bacterium]